MAELEDAIAAALKADAGVQALLGSGDACQLYPVAVLESKTPPYCVFWGEQDDEYHTHDTPPTIASSVVTFESLGKTRAIAAAVTQAIYAVLISIRGTYGGVNIQGSHYHGASDSYDLDEQAFVRSAKFKLFYGI